jgi:hypothetical protein
MVGWRKRLGFAAAIELTLRSFVAKGAPQGDGWLFWVSRWMVKRAPRKAGPTTAAQDADLKARRYSE